MGEGQLEPLSGAGGGPRAELLLTQGASLDVAWQAALEELLRLVALGGFTLEPPALPATSPTQLAESVLPSEPSANEVPQTATLPEHRSSAPPVDYEIERLSEPDHSPLSLSDADLFGGEQAVDLLPLEQPQQAASDGGLGFDLFGNDDPVSPGLPPIQVAGGRDPGVGNPDGLPQPAPKDPSPGDPLPPQQAPGHLSLVGQAYNISLQQPVVQGLADANGFLLIEGDGDDRVVLEGGIWSEVIARNNEPGVVYFQDEQHLVIVAVTGAEVEVPGAVVA